MPSRAWFDTLVHPRVRDLAWSLLCPPLHSFGPQPPPGCDPEVAAPQIRQLDHDPAPLDTYLAEKPIRRLGLYHERLLEFHLSGQGAVSALQQGVAVRQDGRTLGELDFLYRAASLPGLVHLEVAFKFFLRINNQWRGIDPGDSLERKVARMASHQLPLSASDVFQRQLAPGVWIAQRAGWIKGCLFEPWPAPAMPAAGKRWLGWWLYADQAEQLPSGHYLPLERSRWLSPARTAGEEEMVGLEFLSRQAASRACMVARMEERAGAWHEVDRGLLMPRSWPCRPPPVAGLTP